MAAKTATVMSPKTSLITSDAEDKLIIEKGEIPTLQPTTTVSAPGVQETQPVPNPEPFYLKIVKWILSLFSKIWRG